MYEKLFKELCERYNRTTNEIRSQRKHDCLFQDRKKIAQTLRAKGLSYPAIGIIMHRDHSSIQYMCKKDMREKRRALMNAYHAKKRQAKYERELNARGNPN